MAIFHWKKECGKMKNIRNLSLFAAVGLVSGVKYRPKPERFHRYG